MPSLNFIDKEGEEKTIPLKEGQSITFGNSYECDYNLEESEEVDKHHIMFFSQGGKFFFKVLTDKKTEANLFYQDKFEILKKGESRELGAYLTIRITFSIIITYIDVEKQGAVSGDTLRLSNTMCQKIDKDIYWISDKAEKINHEISQKSSLSTISIIMRHFFIYWPSVSFVKIINNASFHKQKKNKKEKTKLAPQYGLRFHGHSSEISLDVVRRSILERTPQRKNSRWRLIERYYFKV